MKNFKEFLKETWAEGITQQTSNNIDGNYTFDITHPSVLNIVKPFVGSI